MQNKRKLNNISIKNKRFKKNNIFDGNNIYFLPYGSGISSFQIKLWKEKILQGNGKISENVNNKVTHIV